MTDEEIKDKWRKATHLHSKNSSLAKRIAMIYVDELEQEGVTPHDIDRLFPLTPIQKYLRDKFVDPAME